MFARSGFFRCASLTNSTMTRQLTTKGIRRPAEAREKLFAARIRKRRKDRGAMLFTKEHALKDAVNNTHDARDLIVANLADKIFSKGHRHVASATNVGFVPDGNPATPLVALAGRGGSGKTSLLRSLFRSPREVGRSNRVLRRDAMNFFNVGDVFNVVDLPGFGGTSVPWSTILQHAVLLRNFSRSQPSLKMLYYCMDIHYKHGIYVQDLDILKFLVKEVPNFTIVITKAEQINDGKHSNGFRLEDLRNELLANGIHHPIIVTSAYRMGGIDTLRYDMVMNCVHSLPTERLTFTEAKRLSARLFSQKELSTVRQLYIAPTQLELDVKKWEAEAEAENSAAEHENFLLSEKGEEVSVAEKDKKKRRVTLAEFDTDVEEISSQAKRELDQLTVIDPEMEKALQTFNGDEGKELAYKNLVKKVRTSGLMKFVRETSPYRNALNWPDYVIPTKHPKSNIMRCPEDPTNPYLTQAQFVAPRADMYFRRPNVGIRRSSKKGQYERDKTFALLMKPYTIPYFPDIVDTNMHPLPWTFLGSKEAYYERSGGRLLGVRLTTDVLEGEINPLKDNPAPDQPLLTKELQALEAKRYGTSIAMLQPPEMDEAAIESLNMEEEGE